MRLPARGFILLTTLLLMVIMSVLVLTAMQQILLFAKALQHQKTQEMQFYELESLAYRLISDKGIDAHCIKPEMDANAILAQVAKRGCVIQEGRLQYRYLIEDLGDYACLMVKFKDQMHPSHHTRITVMQNSRYIQIRMIKKGESTNLCEEEWGLLKEGVSCWRHGVL
jgi:type II secretory pathway pseudopilin PulG